jgi:hypothetical protein
MTGADPSRDIPPVSSSFAGLSRQIGNGSINGPGAKIGVRRRAGGQDRLSAVALGDLDSDDTRGLDSRVAVPSKPDWTAFGCQAWTAASGARICGDLNTAKKPL